MGGEQDAMRACIGCKTDTDGAISAALRAQLDRVLDELWAIGGDDRTSSGHSVTIAKLAMRLCRLYPNGAAPSQRVALQTCTLELYEREAKLEHERVPMTRREAALLHYLLLNRERVVPREELMREVWGKWLDGPAARTVDIHVHRLRSKLGQEFAERVETIRHVGYRFSSQPVTRRARARASGAQPTALVPPRPLTAHSYRLGTARAVLAEIADQDVNLVVWQRRPLAGTRRALAAWGAGSPASFDGVLNTDAHALTPLLTSMTQPLRERIEHDLRSLLRAFSRVTGAKRARTTFGVVRTDRCRKFHADFVRYRLITTYLGPGTEWLSEDAVDRVGLARSIECPFEANRAIVRPGALVQRAAAGEVLLMKGASHHCGRGAIHRSPPLTAADSPRVLLTVSTLE